jgi:hypothetical protein
MQSLKNLAARAAGPAGVVRNTRPNQAMTMMHTRRFVDLAVLELLEKTCIGRAGVDAFQFQAHSRCTFNAAVLSERMAAYMLEEEALKRDAGKMTPASKGLAYRLLVGAPPTHGKRQLDHPNVADIVELNRAHGPVVLTMQNLIQPGQGDESYPVHHAAVLVATLRHDGRHIGVLVDGNDLQSNDAMTEIERHLRENGDRRELSELTQHDFRRINEQIRKKREGKPLDVLQLGFRLVDLEDVVKTSTKKFVQLRQLDPSHEWVSNSVRFDESLELQGDPLPKEAADELVALIKQSPSIVERFE